MPSSLSRRCSGRITKLVVGVLCLWTVGCAAAPEFIMMEPQVASDNRYVGPLIDLRFSFQADRIVLDVANTGDGDMVVQWNQSTFVTASGRSVPLVPVSSVPIYTLPAGSRARVPMTLGSWHCPSPTLWHRREGLRKQLVYPDQLESATPQVKVVLPITSFSRDGVPRQDMYVFTFSVRNPGEPTNSAPGQGGGYYVPRP